MPYLVSEHPKYSRRYYYSAMKEYVPSYHKELTEEQKDAQQAVWNFKEGNYTDEQMEWFAGKVRWRYYNFNARVVTFMPCTTKESHLKRWSRLAEYLQKNTRCKVVLDGLAHHGWDLQPKHLAGRGGKKYIRVGTDPWEFKDLATILIDDVITTGETFIKTADEIMWADANSVYGLFFAKTVKPDLPVKDSHRNL